MNARERILGRLLAARPATVPTPAPDKWFAAHARNEGAGERAQRFQTMIEAAHAEVHRVGDDWVETLVKIMDAKRLTNLLLARGTAHGRQASEALPAAACRYYEQPAEAWKSEFFHAIDASLTVARSAIAETGTLILWPDEHEPRLMSLVPPVHFVLLDAGRIHASFFDALRAENWAAGMPTNALLVSGPSKTADIQQTLAYGAHGPKELVVLLKGGER